MNDSSAVAAGADPERERAGRFAPAVVEALAPESLAALMSLVEPDSLDAANAVGALEAVRRLAAWTAAYQAKVIRRLHERISAELEPVDRRGSAALAFSDTATEVGCALRLPERTAAALVHESCALTEQFPATLNALQAGAFSYQCAQTIIDEAGGLPTEAVPAYEAELLALAPGLTRAKLAGKARRLRELAHPESITTRRTKAAADRCVYLQPDRDGMAWLNAYLPAEHAIAAYNRVDSIAKTLQGPAEARTLTQLRADVLAGLLINTSQHPADTTHNSENDTAATAAAAGAGDVDNAAGAPGSGGFSDLCGSGGIRAEVIVTVPVLTLMGLSETPASLEGYGPIAPDVARRLAGTATSFMRMLTHPETGAVLSIGRERYKPPQELRNALRVRDKTCRFPGCSRSAWTCELDHTTDWASGGTTDHTNLAHLCKRHHLLIKHGADWKVTQTTAARLTWTSPRGATYTTEPETTPANLTQHGTSNSGAEGNWAAAETCDSRNDPIDTGPDTGISDKNPGGTDTNCGDDPPPF